MNLLIKLEHSIGIVMLVLDRNVVPTYLMASDGAFKDTFVLTCKGVS